MNPKHKDLSIPHDQERHVVSNEQGQLKTAKDGKFAARFDSPAGRVRYKDACKLFCVMF